MKRFVVIGGGTGSYTVLRGLKDFDIDIIAVVSMFDDGGSTGVLRDEHGILPPGDIRRALVALSSETEVMKSLFTHRFSDGKSLRGHSLGNLIFLGLRDIFGSDEEAIKQAARILKIQGTVLPVSLTDSRLHAVLENGTTIDGETNIDNPKHDSHQRIKKVYLSPPAVIYADTKRAIEWADVIIIGPGDLYTSIIPNLLVEGMKEAIARSRAKKMYVCNLMTKYGETHSFTASDHVKEIIAYSGIVPDYVICNNQSFPKELLVKYEEEQSYPVVVDREEILQLGTKIVESPLIGETLARHDSTKLAKLLSEVGK